MKKLSQKQLIIIISCAVLVVVLALIMIITACKRDENRLLYELKEDGTYAVVDVKNTYRGGMFCKDEITVPATHRGVKVTEVRKMNTHSAKIVVSEGITKIAVNAFANNSKLQSVSLPKSVTSIGNGAFRGCVVLTTVMLDNAPLNCSALKVGESALNNTAITPTVKGFIITDDVLYGYNSEEVRTNYSNITEDAFLEVYLTQADKSADLKTSLKIVKETHQIAVYKPVYKADSTEVLRWDMIISVHVQ